MNKDVRFYFVLATLLMTALCMGSLLHAADEPKAEASAEDDWVVLFDGSSTDAFRGFKREDFPEKGWTIQADGSLFASGGHHDIITREKYSDFILEWEWKLAEGANSGVMYRVAEKGDYPFKTGPEYQLVDADRIGLKSTGAVYGLIKPNDQASINPGGQWNRSRISVNNRQVQHHLNGKLIVEYTWGGDEIKQRIKRSKFKGLKGFMAQDSGHIAFQCHNSDVWFRNIRIKDLASQSSDE